MNPRIRALMIIGLIVVAMGTALYWIFSRDYVSSPVAEEPLPPAPLKVAPRELSVGGDAIPLPDITHSQIVTIRSVTLDQPGFIVVRDDLFGQPAIITGVTSLLPSGTSSNVTIDLRRTINTQETFYIFIHIDSGNSRFKQTEDSPLLTDDGSVFVQKFKFDQTDEGSIDLLLP